MACIHSLDGAELMTSAEFSLLWDEHHGAAGLFFDSLLRQLAKKLHLRNFRRLALASSLGSLLGSDGPWQDERLTVIVRPYAETMTQVGGEELSHNLMQAAGSGDVQSALKLLLPQN